MHVLDWEIAKTKYCVEVSSCLKVVLLSIETVNLVRLTPPFSCANKLFLIVGFRARGAAADPE